MARSCDPCRSPRHTDPGVGERGDWGEPADTTAECRRELRIVVAWCPHDGCRRLNADSSSGEEAPPTVGADALTLVFPDKAPPRLRVAMRSATQRSLERLVDDAHRRQVDTEPAHAAETILELLAALQTHNHRTRGHSERVRAYTKLIADEIHGLTAN